MHGRGQLEGESGRSLRRTGSQHMRSALLLATTKNTVKNPVAVQGDQHSSLASSATTKSDSFFKDGRKISVGDCALFKPPQDSPPFIGLIRWFASNKDKNLQLGVNWLYRPAEIKLGKGIVVEGAPNEIFYSFHKDKIPAASLLHPCKVAFLPKGVGLPAGTSSFVCRRVYDIANKCLWWLTDQDYINERQEEVDQLLRKTRVEMHATIQSGGRSPKQINGPISTSQLKPASDNGQNSGTSLHTQVKGKKRERGDHGVDPVKRERSMRSDDCDSFQYKTDNHLKSEIARITEKGGVMDLEGVEKLVQLMQPDRIEKKLDLVSRSMLANVIAATDNVDCLNRFVQLRGLPVLDEWLQDIHKGKIGDGNGLKESDKSVEEFLLVLLRALDKLPVNLNALQMCNIGKSVNHLRSHKNLEIQRKARSLVDTWKKRVEAEMISIDAKTASTQGVSAWPSKSRLPDASHIGNRTPGGSDVAMKSSVTQNSASKTTSTRSSHVESNMKSATSSPGHGKSASSPSSGKESLPKNSIGGSDVPLVREDRSSSSNQSHNHTQSFPGKEDGKSGIAVPVSVNKMSGSSTRNRKNSGFPGTSVTGSQKEISSSRSSSAHKSTALEKSQSSFSSEKVLEGPIADGSSHKLIVKIPNRVRSPARGVVGGSLEDSTYMNSRVSSPVLSDKQEQFDGSSEDKNDTCRYNVGSDTNIDLWQTDDPKDALAGSAEGATSPTTHPDEGQSMTTEDSQRLIEGPPTNQMKSGKLHASFSSMNALIESCVKYSEANTSLSIEDDVGMKLLASVATGEMSRSDLASPADSTERSMPGVQEVCYGDETKAKPVPENSVAGVQIQCNKYAESDDKKQADSGSRSEDGLDLPKHTPLDFFGDKKCAPSHTSDEILAGEDNKQFDSSSMDVRDKADTKWEIGEKSNEKVGINSSTLTIPVEKERGGESNDRIEGGKGTSGYVGTDGVENCKSGGIEVTVTEERTSTDPSTVDEGKPGVEAVASEQSSQGEHESGTNEGLDVGSSQNGLTSAIVKSEFAERADNEKLQQIAYGHKSVSEATNLDEVGELNEKDSENYVVKADALNLDMEVDGRAADEVHSTDGLGSASNEMKNHCKEVNVESEEILEHISVPEIVHPGSVDHEELQKDELKGSKSANDQPVEVDDLASTCTGTSAAAARASGDDAKIKFDLNEGVSADEGKYGEPVNIMSSGATSVHVINSLAFSVNSIPSGNAASITVAAAAKGPFVPPEDLLRSKGELGWKGSAATSAFRPAEPRKALEIPLGSTNMLCTDASTSKHSRIPLDIDLNVPDERVLEEAAPQDSALAVDSTAKFASDCSMLPNEAPGSMPLRGSGGLDLDLNRVDEASDIGNCSTSSNHKGEGSVVHVKAHGGLPSGDVRRDFDLNDGPGVDDASAEPVSFNQRAKGVMPPQPSSVGLRMNSPGQGSFSWFPPGNTYSTIAIPSMLPDRGEQHIPFFPPSAPQRTFGPSGVAAFTPDVYRGSVLPSSPAVPFPSGHFPCPVFPFSATFPLPSSTFSVGATSFVDSSSGPRLFAPPVHSQLLGPVGSLASQLQRPYMVSLSENNNHGMENNRKWGTQGLDLNVGPGPMESDVREEMFPLSSGQHSVASSQALAEEQARMYSVTSGIVKRKEPEGGWENDSFRSKQSSWQ